MDKKTREELKGESIFVCHKCKKTHGKKPKWDKDPTVIHVICNDCKKQPNLKITYAALSPKLLYFCQNIIDVSPRWTGKILKMLDQELKQKKEDCYYAEIPHGWNVETWEKDNILFTNGLFFMEVKKKQDKYVISTSLCFFDPKDIAFSSDFLGESYDDPFEAVYWASLEQGDIDQKWLAEKSIPQ